MQKKKKKEKRCCKSLGVVAHTCHPSYGVKPKTGGLWYRLAQEKITRTSW
jgi:hypothetical protein